MNGPMRRAKLRMRRSLDASCGFTFQSRLRNQNIKSVFYFCIWSGHVHVHTIIKLEIFDYKQHQKHNSLFPLISSIRCGGRNFSLPHPLTARPFR